MLERISINPNVCHGQACIKGTRVPVYLIVKMLANGDTIEELLEDYPSITKEDILACLAYAGALAKKLRCSQKKMRWYSSRPSRTRHNHAFRRLRA